MVVMTAVFGTAMQMNITLCVNVFFMLLWKRAKQPPPQFLHFLIIYHTGEVEKSESTDKTNRNILAHLKLYSN